MEPVRHADVVIKYGGYVTTGLQAPDAASAALQWLDANTQLFSLSSTDSLEIWSAERLIGADGA